jgi:hypothetical protein
MGLTRKARLALAAAALAALAVTAAAGARTTNFPSHGIVVPGQSIGGITLGMTEQQVEQHWGHGFFVCQKCGKNLVWLYEYPGAEPLGAAIKFNVPPGKAPAASTPGKTATTPTTTTINPAAKVVAVFTLGSPLGWGTKGAMMFDPVSNIYNLFGNTGDAQCIGYDALTVRIGQSTMSFYTASGVIYGYALTAPSQPPCQ